MTTQQRMRFEDLLAQPEDGYLYELVRGEILRMPPPKGQHGLIEMWLAGAIERYLYNRAVGTIVRLVLVGPRNRAGSLVVAW
jgi:Uma2 family endonuclease